MSTRASADKRSSPSTSAASPPAGSACSPPSPSATPLGAVISRYSRFCRALRCKLLAPHTRPERAFTDPARAFRCLGEHTEVGDVVIPFDQRGNCAKPPHGALIEGPHLLEHGMVMGIEQMSTVIAVPGKMKLHDPLNGNRVEIFFRAETMIESVDENIVDVEQNAAIGLLGNGA